MADNDDDTRISLSTSQPSAAEVCPEPRHSHVDIRISAQFPGPSLERLTTVLNRMCPQEPLSIRITRSNSATWDTPYRDDLLQQLATAVSDRLVAGIYLDSDEVGVPLPVLGALLQPSVARFAVCYATLVALHAAQPSALQRLAGLEVIYMLTPCCQAALPPLPVKLQRLECRPNALPANINLSPWLSAGSSLLYSSVCHLDHPISRIEATIEQQDWAESSTFMSVHLFIRVQSLWRKSDTVKLPLLCKQAPSLNFHGPTLQWMIPALTALAPARSVKRLKIDACRVRSLAEAEGIFHQVCRAFPSLCILELVLATEFGEIDIGMSTLTAQQALTPLDFYLFEPKIQQHIVRFMLALDQLNLGGLDLAMPVLLSAIYHEYCYSYHAAHDVQEMSLSELRKRWKNK